MSLLLWVALTPCLAVREIDVTIPTDAGPDGVGVRVAVPDEARYVAGAPVVVHVPGGWGTGDRDRLLAPLAALGMVELRFEFPVDDARGPASTLALADVVAFAGGQTRTTDGRTLAQLCGPVPVSSEVGLIGWSNGGNTAVLALAEHDRKVRQVAWLALWETPVTDATATGLQGDRRWGGNPAYSPITGELRLDRLTYHPRLPVSGFGGEVGGDGAFWFDSDANGRRTTDDYLPRAILVPGDTRRWAYPLAVLREAERRLKVPWPKHILPVAEAEPFWHDRLADGQYLRAAINRPQMLVMVLGSESDHLQTADDHPHLLAAYRGFQQAKARWVRLNPDAAYLTAVSGRRVGEVPAGAALDRRSVLMALAPEAVRDEQLVAAAAAELADRVRLGEMSADLADVLVPTGELPLFKP